MAERWFLKIDGIDGESTDANHKDEIDVDSWSWGLSQSDAVGGGGGGGAGKVKGNEFLTFKLGDVMVTSVQQGDTESTAPIDQFSLNYTKVQFTFVQLSAKGTPEPPVTASWDLKQNKKF